MSDARVPKWANSRPHDDELLTVDWAQALESRLAMIEDRLPETRLLEKSLFTRALTVVGHEALGLLLLISPFVFLTIVVVVLEIFGVISLAQG